ncbi:MAG: hypothetical protein LBF60_00405 [Treponema sp.]|nr:hypothetical protein [Treponema sp.]
MMTLQTHAPQWDLTYYEQMLGGGLYNGVTFKNDFVFEANLSVYENGGPPNSKDVVGP